MGFRAVIRKPSACLPILMSLAAVALVLAHILFVGTSRQADEGTAAHLWQLLMVAQLPLLAFFAFRWLPSNLKPALLVVALQFAAAFAALAPVYFLNW